MKAGPGRPSKTLSRVRQLWHLCRGDGLRAQLVRGGAVSVVIQVVHTLLALALAILLARTLGPTSYGVYSYVLALVTVLAIPAQFGLPDLVVRETARARTRAHWSTLIGLWRWASATTASISLALAVLGGTAAWLFAERFTAMQLATFLWGLALVPLMALGRLRGAALRGLRRVVQGQLPDNVLRPGLLILFVMLGLPAAPQGGLTSSAAMALHALAAACAFGVGALMLRRARTRELSAQPKPRYEHRAWLTSALPLGLTAGMLLINKQTDILVLGLFVQADEVGAYRVAVQGAMLVAFGLHAANKVVAPHLVRLHFDGDRRRLQRLIALNARAVSAIATPVALAFVLAGDPILGTIFGREYAVASTSLSILALGQLVNATMGSVGQLLTMTGHERDVARATAIGAGANIALNLLLVPFLGMEGAAIATAASLMTWNVLMMRCALDRLGVNANALARVPE